MTPTSSPIQPQPSVPHKASSMPSAQAPWTPAAQTWHTEAFHEQPRDEQETHAARSGYASVSHTGAPQGSVLLDSAEARRALQVLQEASVPPPSQQDVADVAVAMADAPEHRAVIDGCKEALLGRGPTPSVESFGRAIGQLIALKPGDVARNVTAYVFYVMLEAQRQATQEKRDVLKAMKMHAGMLEHLNSYLSRVVVKAQRSISEKIKAGQHKDSISKRNKWRLGDRDERVEEVIGMPQEVDTTWGAVDAATGRVYIPALEPQALVPTKVDTQDLTALITQTDQWRASLQNLQNKEGLEFKRLDDTMSSSWQLLSGFLKSAQEGASAIMRNGLG